MSLPLLADLHAAVRRELPGALVDALTRSVEIAHDLGIFVYVVGGPVRDLLLGRTVDDLDLVLEGDAIAVAERFHDGMGGKLTRHTAFGTANVAFEVEGRRFALDFVTARAEIYPAPAALPVVRPADIEADLRRRDFTVNTLALDVTRPHSFKLLDLCDGLADLRHRRIRILHDRSFVDDPTRILRGARFAARLGFGIEPHTGELAAAAARGGMIERTSPARILHELWQTFREAAPQTVFDILARQGALDHIVHGLPWGPELAQFMATIRGMEAQQQQQRLLLLGLLAGALSPAAREAFVRRYGFTGVEQRVIAESGALPGMIAACSRPNLRPSEIDGILHSLTGASLALAEMIAPQTGREAISRYHRTIRPVRPLLNGDDLGALGIPPGPRYRSLLDGLRAAQIDGEVSTRDEAEQWVRRAALSML